jgi:hypothetical protein
MFNPKTALLLCFRSHKLYITSNKQVLSVKFKTLQVKAKELDNLIDNYLKIKGTSFVPFRDLEKIVIAIFPQAVRVNFGLHKLVFSLSHKAHILALKVGKAQSVEYDHKVYKKLPRHVRSVYFARIFWHTKYCLLQEWGIEAEVAPEHLVQIRMIAEKYGLLDITCDNIRIVNGSLKIIDAVVAPDGMFRLWKTYDSINHKLPAPVRKAIRKSRERITVKQ